MADFFLQDGHTAEDIDYAIEQTKFYDTRLKPIVSSISRYNGKSFSVLGDSISTFDKSGKNGQFADGTSILPKGSKIYYDGTNAGVADISQMWWSVVADSLGLKRFVINAWSGSKVSSIDADTQNFIPMSDIRRCQNLHRSEGVTKETGFYFAIEDGKPVKKANTNYECLTATVYAGQECKVNCISMSANAVYICVVDAAENVVYTSSITGNGTATSQSEIFVVPENGVKLYATSRITSSHTENDLKLVRSSDIPDYIFIFAGTNDFSKANAALGEVLASKMLPTDNSTFCNAYALMLSHIQSAYPSAQIFCISLPIFVRTNTDQSGIEVASDGKTIVDYNHAIKEIAELFGCKYVDISASGVTRMNCYPKYIQDNSTTPTHPNAAGHKKYAETIISQLIR